MKGIIVVYAVHGNHFYHILLRGNFEGVKELFIPGEDIVLVSSECFFTQWCGYA